MPPLKGEVPAKQAEGFNLRRIREVQFMLPEFVARPGGSKRNRALPGGQCPPVNPQEHLRIRKIREVQFMLPEFVARTGGSERQSAQPTADKLRWGSGGAQSEAEPPPASPRRTVSARQSARNLADSKTLAAPIYGGQRSSIGYAAASGSRHCRQQTNFGGGLGEREAKRSLPQPAADSVRLSIRKEACGFAEFGKSCLCFPNSSPEPAAASGCRPCRPGEKLHE